MLYKKAKVEKASLNLCYGLRIYVKENGLKTEKTAGSVCFLATSASLSAIGLGILMQWAKYAKNCAL